MFFRSEFQGYSVRFSPYEEGRIAVATAQNFGIVGNGKQLVLDISPQGLMPRLAFDTRDGVYDCCWSESNENILVSACGDGTVKVWDLMAPPAMNPIRSFAEHKHEVYGVSWNLVRRDLLLSASWDDTIRMWDVDRPGGSVRVFPGHTYCVYAANWSPHHGEVFVSASGDGTSKVWDLRQPGPSISFVPHPPLSPGAPPFEVLTADWCKYNDCIIATGSVDKTIKVWDLRNLTREVALLEGHNFAVRRLQFSPHRETVLASCSYDMGVCFWDFGLPGPKLIERLDHHTEFAVGLDFSVLQEGLVASTGWDDTVYVWRMGQDPRAPYLT